MVATLLYPFLSCWCLTKLTFLCSQISRAVCCMFVHFWLIRSFADPTYTFSSVIVRGSLHTLLLVINRSPMCENRHGDPPLFITDEPPLTDTSRRRTPTVGGHLPWADTSRGRTPPVGAHLPWTDTYRRRTPPVSGHLP